MATATVTPSTERYDRQIRLWGESGQAALSRASVLVVGSSATATETLKNLVLPGIGSFTIVDGATCGDTHAANFFVPTTDASSSAASAAKHLAELNPAVGAAYIHGDLRSFLHDESTVAAFVAQYTLVIIAQLGAGDETLQLLESGVAAARVPLLTVRTYGSIGLLRLHLPGGTAFVLDDRQNAVVDLRLYAPFEELKVAADEARATLSDPDAARRVPFVLILAVAVADFHLAHRGALPMSSDDRERLRKHVLALCPSGCEDSQNFEEALKPAHLRLCMQAASGLPSNLHAVFADPRSTCDARVEPLIPPMTPDSLPTPVRLRRGGLCDAGAEAAGRRVREEEAFWVQAAAVRRFYDETGSLPLSGALPDMAADTASYVALKRVYISRAASDARRVHTFAVEIAERRTVGSVSYESTVAFCRSVRDIHVVRVRDGAGFAEAARTEGALDAAHPNRAAPYYALLRTIDDFHAAHGRTPGDCAAALDADSTLVRQHLVTAREALGVATGPLWRDETDEMVRFAGAELHCVAALIGGITAQEAVKLITRQFVPLNNTLVLNCSTMTSVSFSA